MGAPKAGINSGRGRMVPAAEGTEKSVSNRWQPGKTGNYNMPAEIAWKDRVRQWRGKLTQKEAADIIGVPAPTWRAWEYGKRTPKKASAIEFERRMESHPNEQPIVLQRIRP